MQFSSTFILAAVATFGGAFAAPTNNPPVCPPPPAPEHPGSSTCPDNSTSYCCSSGIGILGLNCLLSGVLGGSCNKQTICCINNGNGHQTCTNTNGGVISIPIRIF